MKKKIAFIFSYKFSNIYTKKYQLENLSKFFNIIVYDLSKIYSPYLKKNIKINSRFKPNKLFILNNLSDFKSSLKKTSPDYTFLIGDRSFYSEQITLTRSVINTKFVSFFTDSLLYLDSNLNKIAIKKILFSNKLFKFFFIISKIALLKIVILFKKKNEKKITLDYLFYSGDKSYEVSLMNAKKKISIPCLNYNDTIEIKNKKKKLIKKKYAVFIDPFYFFHDDFNQKKGNKIYRPVSLNYFKEMNNFFSLLERKLKLKVVIASHPSCSIKKYKLFFNNRTCIQNETAHLVRDSEIVLTHPSTTAINFPIIYNKPLVLLTTNEMNKSFYYYKYLQTFKLIYKYNYLNVSSISNNFVFPTFKIDKKAFKWHYKKFINSSNITNKSLSEFVIKYLK
jgi:hypothetical protein